MFKLKKLQWLMAGLLCQILASRLRKQVQVRLVHHWRDQEQDLIPSLHCLFLNPSHFGVWNPFNTDSRPLVMNIHSTRKLERLYKTLIYSSSWLAFLSQTLFLEGDFLRKRTFSFQGFLVMMFGFGFWWWCGFWLYFHKIL